MPLSYSTDSYSGDETKFTWPYTASCASTVCMHLQIGALPTAHRGVTLFHGSFSDSCKRQGFKLAYSHCRELIISTLFSHMIELHSCLVHCWALEAPSGYFAQKRDKRQGHTAVVWDVDRHLSSLSITGITEASDLSVWYPSLTVIHTWCAAINMTWDFVRGRVRPRWHLKKVLQMSTK